MKKDRNERNIEYEKKFKAYLFRGNWERHKEICKNINVVESTPETRGESFKLTEKQAFKVFEKIISRYTIMNYDREEVSDFIMTELVNLELEE